MTLEKTLRQHLNKAPADGVHVAAGGWEVTLSADKCDSLSCSLKELEMRRADALREELRPWAERVAERVTGLMEPLRLIEVDTPLGQAVLRSDAPVQAEGKAYYYELVLERTQRTRATLKRYAGDRQHGGQREAVPFALTHDTIVKLVSDVAGNN